MTEERRVWISQGPRGVTRKQLLAALAELDDDPLMALAAQWRAAGRGTGLGSFHPSVQAALNMCADQLTALRSAVETSNDCEAVLDGIGRCARERGHEGLHVAYSIGHIKPGEPGV